MRRPVAMTHGHEAGWAALPVAGLLRRIGEGTDILTYLGEYTASGSAPLTAGGRADGATASWRRRDDLPPGPRARAEIRERYGLTDRPVVVCVSRLVPRKGQDTLIRAWPAVLPRCRTRQR